MKVQICTGTRCVFYGADNILDNVTDLKESLSEYPSLPEGADFEIELCGCDGTCKTSEKRIAPVVTIDGEKMLKATSPQVMERILDGLQEGE